MTTTTATSSRGAGTRYAWLDQSAYVRVPKAVLDEVHFLAATDPVFADGTVSESLADTQNLTEAPQKKWTQWGGSPGN